MREAASEVVLKLEQDDVSSEVSGDGLQHFGPAVLGIEGFQLREQTVNSD